MNKNHDQYHLRAIMDPLQQEQHLQRFETAFTSFAERFEEFYVTGPVEKAKVEGEKTKLKKLHLDNVPEGDVGYVDGVKSMDWCVIAFLDAVYEVLAEKGDKSLAADARRKFSQHVILMQCLEVEPPMTAQNPAEAREKILQQAYASIEQGIGLAATVGVTLIVNEASSSDLEGTAIGASSLGKRSHDQVPTGPALYPALAQAGFGTGADPACSPGLFAFAFEEDEQQLGTATTGQETGIVPVDAWRSFEALERYLEATGKSCAREGRRFKIGSHLMELLKRVSSSSSSSSSSTSILDLPDIIALVFAKANIKAEGKGAASATADTAATTTTTTSSTSTN